jgi:hypothetical protein
VPQRDIDLPNPTGVRDSRLPSASRSADLRLQRDFYEHEAARRRAVTTKPVSSARSLNPVKQLGHQVRDIRSRRRR